MSPVAEPANPPAAADSILPARVLQDGEIIILAIKPSGWFLLLRSWPVVVIASVVAAVASLAGRFEMDGVVPSHMLLLACVVVAGARVLVAGVQWLGRLYVLTNRRVMWIHGVFRIDVRACPLTAIHRTSISAGPAERLLALGSLLFVTGEAETPPVWLHIARAAEVQQLVNDAIRQAG